MVAQGTSARSDRPLTGLVAVALIAVFAPEILSAADWAGLAVPWRTPLTLLCVVVPTLGVAWLSHPDARRSVRSAWPFLVRCAASVVLRALEVGFLAFDRRAAGVRAIQHVGILVLLVLGLLLGDRRRAVARMVAATTGIIVLGHGLLFFAGLVVPAVHERVFEVLQHEHLGAWPRYRGMQAFPFHCGSSPLCYGALLRRTQRRGRGRRWAPSPRLDLPFAMWLAVRPGDPGPR